MKVLRICLCEIVGANALGGDVGFAPLFAPLPGIESGYPHDKQEYSPLYYNDNLVLDVSYNLFGAWLGMLKTRPDFVANRWVAMKFVHVWAGIPTSALRGDPMVICTLPRRRPNVLHKLSHGVEDARERGKY